MGCLSAWAGRGACRPAASVASSACIDDALLRVRLVTRGYSPITAQSRPIMMKNPLNSAIRPSPP